MNFYEMVSLSSTSHKTRPVIKEGSSLAQTDKKQTNQPTNQKTNKPNNMDAQEKRDSFKFFFILFLLQQL